VAEEDETPPVDSSPQVFMTHQTKQKIIRMSEDAQQLNSKLQRIVDRLRSIETELKDTKVEQQKQKTINEHLLSQLINSKQKEQMFEKVMTLVLQFFQNKNLIPATSLANPSAPLVASFEAAPA